MPFSLRGVIFDFDGPIFDGRAASQKALTATFDQYAPLVGRPGIPIATLPLYGPGSLIALAYADTPAAAPKLAEICDFYRKTLEACERHGTIVTGILSILQGLNGRDIKCAIRPEVAP
jgi:phosphoglycolate phosphatase-like HAD superfamily hydrolase